MGRVWLSITVFLLLGGCGEPIAQNETADNTAATRSAAAEEDDLPPLEPVTSDEFANGIDGGAGCDLSIDGELLLVTTESGDAVAKWRGKLVRLRHAIGVSPEKGGRFIGVDGDPIVDVGTPEGDGEQAGADVTSWRVQAHISSPDSAAEPRAFGAVWSCGG